MRIESVSNNLIKQAFSLQQKKYRDQDNQFLGQGIRLVADACLYSPALIERIFVTDKCADEFDAFLDKNSGRFCGATGLCLTKSTGKTIKDKMIYVSEQVIKKLSLSDSAQEIIAVINKREEVKPQAYALFLDRIRDPGNLGSILRTAAAAGFSLILDNCADIYSPKVVQSSMSAILSVNFCYGNVVTLRQLKHDRYTVAAADLEGENLFKSKLKTPVCVVIGNEANGVSDEILNLADKKITIPMEKTESLNASVSAGIVMYYIKEMS